MKVYFHGFWSGFHERTNPVHCQFFLDLFSKIWDTSVEIGTLESSDILCESIFAEPIVQQKSWKYTVLFSGESRLQIRPLDHLYTFVLYGQRNHKNRINCPLFVPYLHCNRFLDRLQTPMLPRIDVPQNAVLAIISNTGGKLRNLFLAHLEKRVHVCYGGAYKNNLGNVLPSMYNTPEFESFISQFKFVIGMENSREDTYITEKICHGMLAKTVPIYWGSPRVKDYFNPQRFLCVENEDDFERVFEQIDDLMKDDSKWLQTVNQPVFTENRCWRTLDEIANDCKNLLSKHRMNSLNRLYLISDPGFEPKRYERLTYIVKTLELPSSFYKFLCPTYKHTITDELYSKHVRTPFKELIPWCDRTLYKAELSLILNFFAVLKDIDKNFMDGVFLILESDVVYKENIGEITSFLTNIKEKQSQWDCIHIGVGNEDQLWKTPFPETLTSSRDSLRLSRHLNTRCTDSMLWTKQGVEKMLAYMMKTEDFSEPLDHYMSRYYENNQEIFRYFWSEPTFFIQMTNYGGEQSSIRGS